MKRIWFSGLLLAVVPVIVGFAGCTPSTTIPGITTQVSTTPVVNTGVQHTVGTVVSAPYTNSGNSTFIPAPSTISTGVQSGIWVSGTGVVSVAPDVADINLGVSSQETTVTAAQVNAATAMNQIMAVLKANKVADTDIQTSQFNISPVYNYNNVTSQNNIIGYSVTNTVNVKIRNLDTIGTVIDAVAAAGGDLTVINGISFSVDDPTQYYEQARELAMNDALTQAQQLAVLGEVALGKPVYITESSGSTSTPVYYSNSKQGGSIPPTSINVGETYIVISVQVDYSIG